MNWVSLKRFSLCCLLFTGCLPGCLYNRSMPEDAPVAIVSGHPITVLELKQALQQAQTDDAESGNISITNDTTKKIILNQLIDEYLILQKAKEKKLVVSDETVEAFFTESQRNWEPKAFKSELLKHNLTENEYKQLLKKRLLIGAYLREQVFARIAVLDTEIEDYLQKHPDVKTEKTSLYEMAEKNIRADKEQQAQRQLLASLRKISAISIKEKQLAKIH